MGLGDGRATRPRCPAIMTGRRIHRPAKCTRTKGQALANGRCPPV